MAKGQPLEIRDVSRGVIRKYSVNTALAPLNSVSHSVNFNYDKIIGSAVVRDGTTLVGSQVAANKTPLGLFEFVTGGQSLNDLLSVFSGASTASVYYYDTSWHASGLTNLSNTAKVRFCMLGNQAFLGNGTDAMKSSTDGSSWGTTNCITTDSVKPSLFLSIKNRVLAGGDSAVSRNRVYFSSVVDPSTSPGTITWNTNTTTGNWIDVNPDDGDNVTALQQTSGLALVFKRNSFYRLDAINKTVDLNSIPFGAVSQEATVYCQGKVYFFSGTDICRTDGGFPEQISRLGIQDFIDNISQANWANVAAGTDGNNVSFSIGNVTVGTGQFSTTLSNVVLKFSVRDSSWSVHAYAQQARFYCQFTTSTNGRKMVEADTGGNVQTVDLGATDNSASIPYRLETQELEFGNRAHQDTVTNRVAVYMNYGGASRLSYKEDDDDFKNVEGFTLENRVNIVKSMSATSNFLTLAVSGETKAATGNKPVFEGIYIEDVTDNGIQEQ